MLQVTEARDVATARSARSPSAIARGVLVHLERWVALEGAQAPPLTFPRVTSLDPILGKFAAGLFHFLIFGAPAAPSA